MARMPGVRWAGEYGSRPMSRYDVLCIHTIVGHDPAPAAHFSTGSDGLITQNRDTYYQSAANYQGNHRVIAVENEDFGPEYGAWSSPNVPALTAAQCEAIAQICAWAYKTHGIPLVLCPNSRPESRGIAYHRQGIDGNFGGFAYGGRVAGGEEWSLSFGKVCPGDRRISQVINTIIPRARVLAGLQEDELSWTDDLTGTFDGRTSTYDAAVWLMYANHYAGKAAGSAATAVARVASVESKVDALTAKVEAIATPQVQLDYDRLADAVAARIGASLAQSVNDEDDRRDRDGDPATGQVS